MVNVMKIKRDRPDAAIKIQKMFDTSKEYNSKGIMVINSLLDLGGYYVVSMVPKNISGDDFMVDGLFKVDKKFTSIKEFNLEMDREKYKKALKNPIYIRNKVF